MLRIGKKTKHTKEEVFEMAKSYFGPEGVGLETQARGPQAIGFSGGGGFVLLQVKPAEDPSRCEVEIQSREWDYHVRRFLGQI